MLENKIEDPRPASPIPLAPLINLKECKIKQLLNNDAARKKIVLLVENSTETENNQGIVIVEKIEFAAKNFPTDLQRSEDDSEPEILKLIQVANTFQNDIYADYFGILEGRLNQLKVSTIYPATEAHIKKYSTQEFFLIEETPEIFENIILPLIQSENFSVNWVYNVLDHEKELDRIVFEDLDPVSGFMLMKDMKWNGQVESMHLSALVKDRSIKSLRDLKATHLPLLENVKKKSLEAISSQFGLDKSQVRAYLHYQPSYYHLHVHFTNIKFDAPGLFCDRGHLLNTVISNIKIASDYYQRATLTFATGSKSKIYEAVKQA